MHRNEWEWKHNNPKPLGYFKSSAKGNVHSSTGLPHEKGDIIIGITEIKWIIRDYLQQLYDNKLDNLRKEINFWKHTNQQDWFMKK